MLAHAGNSSHPGPPVIVSFVSARYEHLSMGKPYERVLTKLTKPSARDPHFHTLGLIQNLELGRPGLPDAGGSDRTQLHSSSTSSPATTSPLA